VATHTRQTNFDIPSVWAEECAKKFAEAMELSIYQNILKGQQVATQTSLRRGQVEYKTVELSSNDAGYSGISLKLEGQIRTNPSGVLPSISSLT
jgi:hypothetical protein